MNISYVTIYDALNIHNWSGLGYYIARSLEDQQAQIDFIGDLHANKSLSLKTKYYFYKILGKSLLLDREPTRVLQYAKHAKSLIKPNTDIIFSPGTTAISLIDSKIPKVFYTDATFAGMVNFYDQYTNLCSDSIRNGNYLEQELLQSCKMAIYSSNWAAKSAIDNYKINPEKVKVVPFGANIECNRDLAQIKNIVYNRSLKECNLLFIGVDWKRKGGDLAVNVARELNQRGINTKLHITGIKDIRKIHLPNFVVNHGFISKTNQNGINKLEKLYSESHFLLVPSRAEAFGIVFCEASSFGLPSLSTNVGGITSAIRDDINGKTFPLDSTASEYADFIDYHFSNKNKYEQLCFSSFNEYEKRLNWQVAGKSLMNLLKEI